jgi:hypothetical protein
MLGSVELGNLLGMLRGVMTERRWWLVFSQGQSGAHVR